MATLTVGPGRDFSTIALALAAANSNDVVLIDPGTYTEALVLPQKSVHLLGRTSDLESTSVRVTSVEINYYTSGVPLTYIIENIYFYIYAPTLGEHQRLLRVYNSSDITIVLNRCKFYVLGYYTVYDSDVIHIGYCTNVYIHSHNCDILSWGSPYTYHYDCRIVSSTNCYVFYTKLRYVEQLPSNNQATKLDYVLDNVIGYGTGYGSNFLNLPKSYKFAGRVTTLGVPSSNVIRAYRKSTHTYEGYTSSDSSTGDYSLYTTYSGTHQLICESVTNPLLNDKIISHVVPVSTTPTTIWDEAYYLTATISGTCFSSDAYGVPVFMYFKDVAGVNAQDTAVVLDNLFTQNFRKRWSVWSSEDPYQLYCAVLDWSPETRTGSAVIKLPYIPASRDTQLIIRYDRNVTDNNGFVFDAEGPYTYPMYMDQCLAVWMFNQAPTVGTSSLIDETFNKKHGTPVGDFYISDLVDSPTGKAWQFSGSNYVHTADTNMLGFNPGNWSVTLGFSVSTLSGVQTIHRSGTEGGGIELGVDENILYVSAQRGIINITLTASGVVQDTWHLATIVCDKTSSTLSLYLDSVLKDVSIDGVFGTNFLISGYNYIGNAPTRLYQTPKLDIPTLISGTVLYVACSGTVGEPNLYDALGNYTLTKYLLTGEPGYITNITSKVGNTSYYYAGKEYFLIPSLGPEFNVARNAFSISFWHYSAYSASVAASIFTITSEVNSSPAGSKFCVYMESAIMYCKIVRTDGASTTLAFGTIAESCWQHYAVYREDTLFYIKWNGVLVISITSNSLGVDWSGLKLYIGFTSASHWIGYLNSILVTIGSKYEPTQEELLRFQSGLKGKVDYLVHSGKVLSTSEIKLQQLSYVDQLFTFQLDNP